MGLYSRSWLTYMEFALAAISVPILVTGYLTLVGYRLGELQTLFSGGAVYSPTYLYLLSLMVLGVGLVVGVQQEFWAAVGVGVAGLLVLPWFGLFGQGPNESGTVVGFMAESLIIMLGFFAVAATQLVATNRQVVSQWITPRRLVLGVAVGIGQFLLVVLIRNVLWGAPYWSFVGFGGLLWLWSAAGLVLLGVILTMLFTQFRLVTPVMLVGTLLLVATTQTLSSPAPEQSGATAGMLTYYAVAWFVPLILAILVAYIENLVRNRWDVFPLRTESSVK